MRKTPFDSFTGRHITWMAVLFSVIIHVIHSAMIHPWMLDDAFISFRYAEHLAAGNGLVYNAGERVEGYTTFLWVVLISVGRKVGVAPILFSKVIGALCALGTLLLLAHAHRFGIGVKRQEAAMATLFLGSCGVFTSWALSGMEVSLFTFLILLVITAYHIALCRRDQLRLFGVAGVLCALAALTRPEGAILVLPLLARTLALGRNHRIEAASLLLGAFMVVFVPYLVWRYFYYGYLLPNTYYAKVGFGIVQYLRGLLYLGRFANTTMLLLIPAMLYLISLKWCRTLPNGSVLPLVMLCYGAHVVAVGGDAMPAFRFLAPVLPLLCLVTATSVFAILNDSRPLLVGVIVAAIVSYNLVEWRFGADLYTKIKEDTIAGYGMQVGLWLKQNVDPGSLIATNTAGTIPYFSKLRTVDMLGLNDEHIAHREIPTMGQGDAGHEKGDGNYVLLRRPDYIFLGSALGSPVPVPIFLGDVELYRNPAFHREYRLVTQHLSTGEVFYYFERVQESFPSSPQSMRPSISSHLADPRPPSTR